LRFLERYIIVVVYKRHEDHPLKLRRKQVIMSELEIKKQPGKNISLPIEWHVPEGMQSRYATNVVAQAGSSEIILTFFEAQLPILLGQPEENEEALKKIGSIRAECVGKIIVSPETAQSILIALQTSIDAYNVSKDLQAKENSDGR
jgi:hypothetical protein